VTSPTTPDLQARREVTIAALGGPIGGLSSAQLASFQRGQEQFERAFIQSTGLGPTFNASSCVECHGEEEGPVGGTGDEVETHFTNVRLDGTCDELESKGGFVHQDSVTPRLFNATGLTEEPFPSTTHQRGARTTPDIFGFGLIASIPNSAIINQADPNDANGDGVSGRVHYDANNDVGKFGRKAQEGSITLFNAGALVAEMGITNKHNLTENSIGGAAIPFGVDPTPEPEIASADFDDLNNFVIFLAPPPPVALTSQTAAGRDLFNAIGCATCHTPQYTTTDVGIAALSFKTVRPFSDFLLHDMGRNDICLFQARRTEIRTEPLMGARFMEQFMHDGAATTITGAINLHGGEGSRARSRFFNNLTSTQQQAVVAYVLSL
jgi:CxxC motif-containing protein (DUF1111 family)